MCALKCCKRCACRLRKQRSSCSPLRQFQAGRQFQPLRSLASVYMHCFGKFAMRAHISRALRLSASVTMSDFRRGCWLQTLCFGSSRRKVHCARSSIPASVFRQGRRGSICIGVPRRLTIRSSRPHVVASAMCFTLRLHMSAAPPRVGLTQALGTSQTKQGSSCLFLSLAYFR